jgi:3-hydroxyisobutyrate dehydrogenase-like beta-hydroxyacid dehydrogenase
MSAPALGLCGCGNMGAAIAQRLSGRAELTVFDLDPARAAATGAPVAAGLDDLARRSSVVLLSLPSAAASAAVVPELAAALAPGSTIVETSTVNPSDVRALEPVCAERGLHLVDAAILSGPGQMRTGATTLLIGGEDEAVAAAQPALALLGGRHVRLGALGTGMAAKVANNAVSHAVMVVLLEAAAMADAAGVPTGVFAELLSEPDAGLLRPLAHRLRERVLDGDYAGGMPTEAALKDSQLALRLAEETGVPLHAIAGAHRPYELAVEAGLGREDYAAIAKLWEEWTGRPYRRSEGP